MITSTLRLGATLCLPAGRFGKLSILMFHSVVSEPNVWRRGSIVSRDFDMLMKLIAENFCVLPLEDGIVRLKKGSLPARSVAITFDDGYLDNRELALPILQKYGLTATFFITTGTLHGGLMWNDRVLEAFKQYRNSLIDLDCIGLGTCEVNSESTRVTTAVACLRKLKDMPPNRRDGCVTTLTEQMGAKLDKQLMLSDADVLYLAHSGMSIGAHTVTHPILTKISNRMAEEEIRISKQELTDVVGREIKLFAYPNGRPSSDYNRIHVDIVDKLGFLGAVTTSSGVSRRDTDCFQLPRFTPWERTPALFSLKMLLNGWRLPTTI